MAAVIVTGRQLQTRMPGHNRHSPKCCKLALNSRLGKSVAGKLKLEWSPEQIAGWLKRTHPDDEYNGCRTRRSTAGLFVQARGVRRKKRELRASSLEAVDAPLRGRFDPNCDRQGHIVDAVSIRERPAETADRRDARPLGGRSALRAERQSHRDARRASIGAT